MENIGPEHTAVRVALWRALHVQIDSAPHIFHDEIGAELVGDSNWRERPDMNPDFSKSMRASIVGRARFVEDSLVNEISKGVSQYVILGAGLDTFAQRNPELVKKLSIFEIDQPGPQKWKIKRLQEAKLPIPENLHFVPVNFENDESWWDKLLAAGFNPKEPAFVVSTGVSMYLSKETNFQTLKKLASLGPGSTLAMTFLLSLDLLPKDEGSIMEFVMKKAAESGTPFLSLFTPDEILTLGKQAGFTITEYVSAQDLYQRYFASRSDNLNAGTAEAFFIGKT